MAHETPTTATMIAQWNALAQAIATAEYDPAARGQLAILGSGLSFVDFTRDAEGELASADAVFHCVYDKVTQAWIGQVRPDAYDLRILYGEHIDRQMIYIRMAEAMLHHVRLGGKVVAVFYGHPGIFATPAHRAIHVARAEGHQARMRPGISALDYLVADIGFDPALPGLSTFEATDMLLRGRRIDPTLHVVLWQVGVVGEREYAPRGFENKGFDLLVARLRETYGPDWLVTHYIAPQYVGIDPLIEHVAVADLPAYRDRITSLSTFYIEPKVMSETDMVAGQDLGYVTEGSVPQPYRTFDYTVYGRREQVAVRQFASFVPPSHYRLAPSSPELEFMLALSRDVTLQDEYRRDPAAVVARAPQPIGTERKARLLAIPHPKAIDAALAEDMRVEA